VLNAENKRLLDKIMVKPGLFFSILLFCSHIAIAGDSGFSTSDNPNTTRFLTTTFQHNRDTITFDTICSGESITLSAPNDMVSYLWSNDATSQTIEIAPEVSAWFWVNMIDTLDIESRDSIWVEVEPLPEIISASPDTLQITAGDEGTLFVEVQPDVSVLWSTGSTEPDIQVAPVVNTQYNVVVSSIAGCSVTKDFFVEVTYETNMDFTYDTVCFGDTTHLYNITQTTDSIVAVLWDMNSDGVFDDAEGDTVKHVFAAGGFHLAGMRMYFKTSPMQVVYNAVPVGSLPEVDFGFENTCQSSTTVFTDESFVAVGTENRWFWDFGDGKSDVFQTTSNFYVNAGTYSVMLKVWTDLGCFDSIVKPVTINVAPDFTFVTASDSIIANDDTAYFAKGTTLVMTVNIQGNYDSVVWYNGTTDLSVSITEAGVYNATVYNKGCAKQARFFAVEKGGGGGDGTEIMNLYTPNGDGFNDFWLVNNPDVVFPIKVVVYNRSGRSVYASDNYQNDWSGLSEGNPLPQATYYYVIKDNNGSTFKGPVTIIR